ncbi:hypothetical protein LDENG_00019210 [Lucifuga dentata]|nr:hypothetical protein LDENG_00019210 [Lucifuga dentata]
MEPENQVHSEKKCENDSLQKPEEIKLLTLQLKQFEAGFVASVAMVDIAVSIGAAWACQAQEHHLSEILLPVHISDESQDTIELSQGEKDMMNRCGPVLLEQVEEGSSCVLTLLCSPASQAAISRLLVISEARTMEVYGQAGEYCGTTRGERDNSVQTESADRGPFYRKQLILQHPSTSCEMKLLSLAGRNSVSVCCVIVGLRPLQLCLSSGPGIDMQRVQSLVEEMGMSLSPGAQNLMEMVHFQQQNQSSSLGGFLPLLMGSGALSALARGANISTAADRKQTEPPANDAPPAQNGVFSDRSASSSPGLSLSGFTPENTASSESGGPLSHTQLTGMMSHFLKGQGRDQLLSSTPEFLPILQNVCGQVMQLRLDVAAAAKKEQNTSNCTWELDSAMERRLEEMERRLKEHIDHRLDALEQKLEKALLSALPLIGCNRGAAASPAPTGTSEQIYTGPTPAPL